MRTREEQIEEIKERVEDLSLVNCYPEFSEIQDWLIEAERRAEQRVRAEIGRDSERLDWLLSRTHYGIPGFDPKVSGRSTSERKDALIRAIDVAMEGGNG